MMATKRGITLQRAQHDAVASMFDELEPGMELECVVKQRLNDVSTSIDRERFRKCLMRMVQFGKSRVIEGDEVLTLGVDDLRVSFSGLENISEYCKTNRIDENIMPLVEVMRKTKSRVVDIPEYDLRVRLAKEEVIDKSTPDIQNLLALLPDKDKHYRLKKRYSVLTPDDMFRIDFTIVKSSTQKYKHMAVSSLQRSAETFEIEVEFVGDHKAAESQEMTEALFDWVAEVLAALDNQDFAMNKVSKGDVVDKYIDLVKEYIAKDMSRSSIQYFKRNKPKKLFIAPQPVTLEMQNLLPAEINTISICLDYTVTEKADGERCLVFIDETKEVYTIDNRLNVKKTGLASKAHTNTVLDAELVTLRDNTHKLLCFDAYIVDGELVADKPLIERTANEASRYNSLKQVVGSGFKIIDGFSSFEIVYKDFKVAKGKHTIFDLAEQVLNSEKDSKFEYEIDGLILTPAYLPVGGTQPNQMYLGGTWKYVFKWKPPKDNTIDFLLSAEKHGDARTPVTRMDRATGKTFLKYNLFVGSQVTNPEEYFAAQKQQQPKKANGGKPAARYIGKRFIPPGVIEAETSIYWGELQDEGRNTTCDNGDEITDMSIVEMAWENKVWKPKRVRYDKTEEMRITRAITANNFENAAGVWRSIVYPVTDDHITGKVKVTKAMLPPQEDRYYARNVERSKSSAIAMLNFHNHWVKNRSLVGRFKNVCTSLMDIGCGKAGDLTKWTTNGFKTVLGVDVNEDNITNHIDGAYSRLADTELPDSSYNYVFVPMFDASKLVSKEMFNEIKDPFTRRLAMSVWGFTEPSEPHLRSLYKLANNRFDVVSCQFAIHYFFKDKTSIDNFCKNVDAHIKPGGYFIGTCLDGAKVANALESVEQGNNISGKKDGKLMWQITKGYDRYSPSDLGQKITVYFETINQQFDEYLVDFELLQQHLARHNIKIMDAEECRQLGIASAESSGLFDELYNEMVNESAAPNAPQYIKKSLGMSVDEKRYSFMNRWFIFKKYDGKAPVEAKAVKAKDKDNDGEDKPKAKRVPKKEESSPPAPKPRRIVTKQPEKQDNIHESSDDEIPKEDIKPKPKRVPAKKPAKKEESSDDEAPPAPKPRRIVTKQPKKQEASDDDDSPEVVEPKVAEEAKPKKAAAPKKPAKKDVVEVAEEAKPKKAAAPKKPAKKEESSDDEAPPPPKPRRIVTKQPKKQEASDDDDSPEVVERKVAEEAKPKKAAAPKKPAAAPKEENVEVAEEAKPKKAAAPKKPAKKDVVEVAEEAKPKKAAAPKKTAAAKKVAAPKTTTESSDEKPKPKRVPAKKPAKKEESSEDEAPPAPKPRRVIPKKA